MSRSMWSWKWTAPAVVFGLMASMAVVSVARAEDAPKDKPATGTVAGTVKDVEGKPAANIRVRVMVPRQGGGGGGGGGQAPANPAAAMQAGERPKPVAEGMTDAGGKFSLADVPVGKWTLAAGGRDAGGWARQPIEVKAGETMTVDLQLQAGRPGGGGGGGGGGGQPPANP